VRAYYTLRRLALNHDVILVSFTRGDDPPSAVDHLRSLCCGAHTVRIRRSRILDAWQLLKSQCSRTPFLIARDRRTAMAALIRDVVADHGPFDVVHSDQLWMAPYALRARDLHPASGRPVTVLDEHNAVFRIPERMAQAERCGAIRHILRSEAKRLRSYEVRTCEEFDAITFVTAQDEASLFSSGLPRSFKARTSVIPIAVQPIQAHRRQLAATSRRVTFMGAMVWPPNAEGVVWFERHVWPLVRAAIQDCLFTVIGAHPPAALGMNGDRSIEVAGYVSDPEPYLTDSSVFVVPLLAGGGMRVKILEAWSRGIPVVSTAVGAEGLHATDGDNILLADSPLEFAGRVIRVLRDPELAARLAEQGRKTLETYYDWRKVYAAWDEVYQCASSSLLPMHQTLSVFAPIN